MLSSLQQGNIASLFSIYFRFKFITSSCKSQEDMTSLSPRGGGGVELKVFYLFIYYGFGVLFFQKGYSCVESVPKFLEHNVLTCR